MRSVHLLLLLPWILACGDRARFSDTVTSDPLIGSGDMVHDYVLGASFGVAVRRPGLSTIGGWSLESSDPEVLAVQVTERERKELNADAIAQGVGEAELQLINPDGEVEGSSPVYVGFPDWAELHSRARALVGEPSLLGEDTPLQVLAGGVGTFETRFFEGDRRLYGKTTLSGTAAEGVDIDAPASSMGDDVQYISIAPAEVGDYVASLSIQLQSFVDLPFTAVDYAAVQELEVFSSGEEGAHGDDVIDVVAELRDAQDMPIFGAVCTWTLDDRPLEGAADRVSYSYDKGQEHALVAECDGFTDSRVVHGYDFVVVGTNAVGCSSGPPAPLGLGALLGLMLIRRRSHQQA